MRHRILFAMAVLWPLAAMAQESSALINKALDEQVKSLVLDKTLPAAMDLIGDKTGVRLKEDPMIWDLLPWGRETTVKAKIENLTLREALEALTRKLGLVLVLRDEYVEIAPMPALKRLAQRASVSELRALDLLASRQLKLGTDHPTVKQLLEAVDMKLDQEKEIQLAVESRIGDAVKADKTVFVPRNATLMEALEALPKETVATWYPWGNNIMIVTKEDRTRRLLAKPLTMRSGEGGLDLTQALVDISQRTGVAFEYQPGVIASLPAENRVLRGPGGKAPVLDNVPAQQILDLVSASTGLAYAIQGDKVYISTPSSAANAANAPRDAPIGFMQLDIGMQVLVPISQVPEDMRQYIKMKTNKELDKIRQMMKEEGFKPAPAPAGEGEKAKDL